MEQKNNTQLPAEVQAEILNKADVYACGKWGEKAKSITHYNSREWDNSVDDYNAGATEYAAKLHEVNQLIKDWEEVDKDKKRLVREIDNIISGGMPAKQASLCDLVSPIRELQEKHNIAVDLLEKFISRHEAGLLPDRFIYQEIKNFLDGK